MALSTVSELVQVDAEVVQDGIRVVENPVQGAEKVFRGRANRRLKRLPQVHPASAELTDFPTDLLVLITSLTRAFPQSEDGIAHAIRQSRRSFCGSSYSQRIHAIFATARTERSWMYPKTQRATWPARFSQKSPLQAVTCPATRRIIRRQDWFDNQVNVIQQRRPHCRKPQSNPRILQRSVNLVAGSTLQSRAQENGCLSASSTLHVRGARGHPSCPTTRDLLYLFFLFQFVSSDTSSLRQGVGLPSGTDPRDAYLTSWSGRDGGVFAAFRGAGVVANCSLADPSASAPRGDKAQKSMFVNNAS